MWLCEEQLGGNGCGTGVRWRSLGCVWIHHMTECKHVMFADTMVRWHAEADAVMVRLVMSETYA